LFLFLNPPETYADKTSECAERSGRIAGLGSPFCNELKNVNPAILPDLKKGD